jgi:hypothetical protein
VSRFQRGERLEHARAPVVCASAQIGPWRSDTMRVLPAAHVVMKPVLASTPSTAPVAEVDRDRHWLALQTRRALAEREIQSVLAAIHSRAAAPGPRQRAVASGLELSRLEAARVRREGIEQEMQAFLDHLDEHR